MTINRVLTRTKFKQLRILVAVSEHRSILHAAHEMNISQPAATNMIKDLEADFDVALFTRTNKGVVPTVYGEALVRNVKLLFSRMSTAVQELDDLRGGASGRVVVGSLPAASSLLLPLAIEKTLIKRPDVTIKVVEGTNEVLLPALRTGDLDMVVGRLPAQSGQGELKQIDLFNEEVIAVVGAQHPLAASPELKFDEMMDFGWILPPANTIIRAQLNQIFQTFGDFQPKSIVESFAYLTNRRLLLRTELIAILPAHVVAFDIGEGYLRRLNLEFPIDKSMVGASLRKEANLSPAAEFFLQALRDAASAL